MTSPVPGSLVGEALLGCSDDRLTELASDPWEPSQLADTGVWKVKENFTFYHYSTF